MTAVASAPDHHESLRIGEAYVRDNLTAGGVECPCCHRYARAYKRKLNSGMAVRLVFAHRAARRSPFNLRAVLMAHPGYGNPVDFSLLRFWGLIEEQPDSAVWAITERGVAFLNGATAIPRYIWHWSNSMLGEPWGPPVTIREALGDHFDYDELMGSVSR